MSGKFKIHMKIVVWILTNLSGFSHEFHMIVFFHLMMNLFEIHIKNTKCSSHETSFSWILHAVILPVYITEEWLLCVT